MEPNQLYENLSYNNIVKLNEMITHISYLQLINNLKGLDLTLILLNKLNELGYTKKVSYINIFKFLTKVYEIISKYIADKDIAKEAKENKNDTPFPYDSSYEYFKAEEKKNNKYKENRKQYRKERLIEIRKANKKYNNTMKKELKDIHEVIIKPKRQY
jgi:hypothetical protein